MGGEDALLADGFAVGIGGFAERTAAEALFEEADGEERGVALVHVIDLGLYAEGLQKSDAAEAKDGLLAEAIVGVAAVEVVGKLAVPGVIAFDVGVEEEDGDDVAGGSDDVEAPGADLDLTVLHE